MQINKLISFFAPLLPAFLMAIFFGLGIDLDMDIKIDTVLIVLGNFSIAYYIASIINTKNKHEELTIDRSFKEIEYLEGFLQVLLKNDIQEYEINKNLSFINLQISLMEKYTFIKKEDTAKLKTYYRVLNKELTGDANNIDQNYKNTISLMEKRLLVIKNNILQFS